MDKRLLTLFSTSAPKFLIFLISSFGFLASIKATHIRAGEIVARRVDITARAFEFVFVGYRDTDSGIEFGGGTFDFGDGTTQTGGFQIRETPIGNNLVRAEFILPHTYGAPGTFVVSYREEFRNNDIANMDRSLDMAFYVETVINIDPIFGVNNTPILTVPPIDDGKNGVRFVHNPGAFDPDGRDSLSYSLVVPQQAEDVEVLNYRAPNNTEFYTNFVQGNEQANGPPLFSIDEITGDLVIDAPGDFFNLSGDQCPEGSENCAEYNVAFKVTEWRQIAGTWREMGSVTRDMQIIITDGDNEKPELEIPDDICVEAGTVINETIIGTDPDGHNVRLEAFGGPFLIESPATFSPGAIPPDLPDFQPTPGTLEFNWNTVCGHVQEQPYTVQFKVSDDPFELVGSDLVKVGPTLVEFGTWEITVVGPAPEGLGVTAASGRSLNLDWLNYQCPNADSIQVWRRVGDFPFAADECLVGIPENSGYELIGGVDIDETSFLDDNFGADLAPGAKYCYRLVAVYPLPNGGTSYASEEVCFTLLADAPVITNVDIIETAPAGSIEVRWTSPLEVDRTQFPPPYSYDVYRAPNFNFSSDVELVRAGVTDTFLVDSGIDTDGTVYSYRVALGDAAGNFVDSSAVASSVRLELEPGLNAIGMTWNAIVPWSNNLPEYPTHYIYRDNVAANPDQLVLIDSVEVGVDGFFYFDDGRFNADSLDDQTEYCYFVTTRGGYDNPILPEPLINNSQIQCGQPSDIVPPCTPQNVVLNDDLDCESRIAQQSCAFNTFRNEIAWIADPADGCDDDIVSYNVYFSGSGLEEDYEVIASVEETSFSHDNLPSFKGCYRISAVDRSGNESEPTEEVCVDNCPNFVLPNVFTPNGDGKNDLFTPLFSNPANPITGFDDANCPRFIEEVQFNVFDRNGKTIFSYNSNDSEAGVLINWNGKSDAGRDLPAGVYFYSAELNLDVLLTSNDNQRLNGWVQILR